MPKIIYTSTSSHPLKKNIRKYLKRLLAQVASPVVEAADARDFYNREIREGPGTEECCTVDNFQIDLSDRLRSAWNVSASRVFAHGYCNFYKVPTQMQREVLVDVAERFLNRVKALKLEYQTQTLSSSEKLRLSQVRRRRTRKTTAGFNYLYQGYHLIFFKSCFTEDWRRQDDTQDFTNIARFFSA